MPQVFQSNWSPQIMPATNMVLPNNFLNAAINTMGGQQYPPMQ
jgi:hypothetical protein